MIFERNALALAAPVIAAAVGVLALKARRRRVRAAAAWSGALGELARVAGHHSPVVLTLVALAAAVALAGPRWGVAARTAESRALNIVVVMDVSRSMLAQDVAPNRLGRAVSAARRLVLDLDGDRFALVAFAGHAYLLSPLTLDESAIALQLDALDPDMASAGGSGLAGALDLARHTLVSSPQGGDRAIVVLTDGESFEGNNVLESAGNALRRAGITLIAIPVGSIEGARILDPDGSWHRDNTGKVVITTRRDDLLHLVTTAAHGVFVAANAPDPVGEARRALAHLNRAPAADRVAADLVPRAWVFALVAAVVLLVHTLTRRTAALAGLLLLVGAHGATAQRPSAGNRLLVRGDTAGARQAFAADTRSRQSDTAWFNAGTSSLNAGDWASAVVQLQAATLSLDPGLRQRALYTLGTANLMQARRDSGQRDTLLADAARQLRDALLLAPGDRNAKFNFELTRRLRPPPKPQSGPGGRGKGNPNQPAPPPPPGGGRGGMTPAAAEQVLNAMERAERDTRQHQYARARKGEPPLGPDW
jgi:Ca-activated chloride channel family protein